MNHPNDAATSTFFQQPAKGFYKAFIFWL